MIHNLLDQIEPAASDDEDDDCPDVEFVFSAAAAAAEGAPKPESCKAVLVCGAGAATAYALSALGLRPVPWTLEVVKETLVRTFPPPPRPPRFFVPTRAADAADAAVAVVVLEGPVPADAAAGWAEALLGAFAGATEVVFLDRIFRAGWRAACGQEQPQEPHLCGLWTSAWGPAGPLGQADNSGPGCGLARLPPPNAIEDLPAALLTCCEASRRRCLVALALQDGAHLGEGSVRAFEALAPLLKRIGALAEDAKAPDYREAVRAVVPPPALSIYA